MLNGFNDITVFASVFSLLSITLSVFESFSQSVLLKSETISVINLSVDSAELAQLNNKAYKKLCNQRLSIAIEISKIINVDRRSIELLLPIQTKTGFDLTFHIRSKVKDDDNNDNNTNTNTNNNSKHMHMMELVKQEVDCGRLAKNIKLAWNLKITPKILKFETKEIQPDTNKNNQAAVISIQNTHAKTATIPSQTQLELAQTQSDTDNDADRLRNYSLISNSGGTATIGNTETNGIANTDNYTNVGRSKSKDSYAQALELAQEASKAPKVAKVSQGTQITKGEGVLGMTSIDDGDDEHNEGGTPDHPYQTNSHDRGEGEHIGNSVSPIGSASVALVGMGEIGSKGNISLDVNGLESNRLAEREKSNAI